MNTVYADDFGFNSENATEALSKAINDPQADKIIVRDMGSPWFVDESIVVNQDNKEIVFEEGVVVRAKPGSFLSNDRSMFYARDVENIKFIGEGEGENRATLKMNKEEYTQSEHGHILTFRGVKGYEVSGLRLTGAGGDGIHISAGTFNDPNPNYRFYSEDGLIENVIADNNRRQGLSIDSAKNLIVRDSTFINTAGTAPSAGIDLEPTWNYESLQNVRIENVDIKDNNGSGIQIALGNLDENSEPVSVEIDNVRIDNSDRSGISVLMFNNSDPKELYKGGFDDSLAKSRVDGVIDISNVDITRTNGSSTYKDLDNPNELEIAAGIFVMSLPGNQDDPDNLQVNFKNVNISDTGNGKYLQNPIYIRGFGGTTQPQEVGNLSFDNVTIRDDFARDAIRADLGRSDGYLNDISGNITVFNPNGVTSFFDQQVPAKNFSLTVSDGNPTQINEPSTNQPTPLTQAITGIVDNPSFSDNLTGWNVWNEGITADNRGSQDRWVRIESEFGGLGQIVSEEIIPGEEYNFSAIAQASQIATKGSVGILFKDQAGEFIEVVSAPVNQTQPQTLELGFTAPQNFAHAEVFAYKENSPGILFADDFALTEIA